MSTYRVEHRAADGRVTVLGRTYAAGVALARHAARLLAAGVAGELVVVDEATGEVAARRVLRPGPVDRR